MKFSTRLQLYGWIMFFLGAVWVSIAPSSWPAIAAISFVAAFFSTVATGALTSTIVNAAIDATVASLRAMHPTKTDAPDDGARKEGRAEP